MTGITAFNGAVLRIAGAGMDIELKDGSRIRLSADMKGEHELWYGFVHDGQDYDLNVWDESVCDVPDGAGHGACVYPVYGGNTDTCTMEKLTVMED